MKSEETFHPVSIEGCAKDTVFARNLKRIFDLVGALGLIILFSPFLLAASVAIFLEDGFPIFFKQQRIGKDGIPFGLYKFRTLKRASPPLHINTKDIKELRYFVFPAPPTDELTRVGRFLRKTGINELPQLLNVLRGEMSLVGPRPEIPEIVSLYPASFRERFSVKPGITSLAYVTGGDAMNLEDAVALDLEYIHNPSLLQDIVILWKTVFVAFSGRGN